MDATLFATLRQLFPQTTLTPASKPETEPLALGPVVDVRVTGQALVVVLEHGAVLKFFADVPSFRVMEEHIRTGELTFDDLELGLRRLAELLGTHRGHLDA